MLHSLKTHFSKSHNEKVDQEHITYSLALERALRSLEAKAHESDDPDYIIKRALKTACEFYGADWSGFAERNLSSNAYEELKRNLKKKDGFPGSAFRREYAAQHK